MGPAFLLIMGPTYKNNNKLIMVSYTQQQGAYHLMCVPMQSCALDLSFKLAKMQIKSVSSHYFYHQMILDKIAK